MTTPTQIDRLPRETYATLKTYVPLMTPVEVELSENTNQWGAPPAAVEALRACDERALFNYPSQPISPLLAQLAEYVGTNDPNTIVLGCGSDDILDCSMRAFAEPGDIMAYSDPTFSMSAYFGRTNGLNPVGVPALPDWDVDVDGLLATKARIIYLCAPNNPTGTPIPDASVRRLLDESEGIVIVDEAYAEFANSSWAKRAPNEERLVVFRTMSKAFGLGGLRIGYAVGRPELLLEIDKASGPFKVNAIAERVAMATLKNGLPWVEARVKDAQAARAALRTTLIGMGLKPLPSESNFVMLPVPNAMAVAAHMRENKIAVRAFSNLAVIGDALRITVGPEHMMQRCVTALDAALKAS
ncbi:MAG: histidinol-phosphate transaminase [Gemmatimonadaceae bacterium]